MFTVSSGFSRRSFGLPPDKEIAKIGVRNSLKLEAGIVPSVDDFTSRRRTLGRGERIGHRTTGRPREIDYIASIIKGELRFRDSKSAPTRRICMLVDLSLAEKNSASTERLCAVSCLTLAALLGASATRVAFQPIGLRAPVRPHVLDSAANVGFIRSTLWHLLGLEKDRNLTGGKFRYAAGNVYSHHCLLVSHYVNPDVLAGFHSPMGLSTVFVSPISGGPIRIGTGVLGGSKGALASDILVNRKYADYIAATRRRFGETRIVSGEGAVVDAFLRSLI